MIYKKNSSMSFKHTSSYRFSKYNDDVQVHTNIVILQGLYYSDAHM